jgi:hypothetical protein
VGLIESVSSSRTDIVSPGCLFWGYSNGVGWKGSGEFLGMFARYDCLVGLCAPQLDNLPNIARYIGSGSGTGNAVHQSVEREWGTC